MGALVALGSQGQGRGQRTTQNSLCEMWQVARVSLWKLRTSLSHLPLAAVASRTSRAIVVRLSQTSAWKVTARLRASP